MWLILSVSSMTQKKLLWFLTKNVCYKKLEEQLMSLKCLLHPYLRSAKYPITCPSSSKCEIEVLNGLDIQVV